MVQALEVVFHLLAALARELCVFLQHSKVSIARNPVVQRGRGSLSLSLEADALRGSEIQRYGYRQLRDPHRYRRRLLTLHSSTSFQKR